MFKTAKSQLIIGGLAAICIALITSTVQAKSLTLPVNANDYRIIDINDEQKIEMEGFNQLMVPGKPMLPCKNYMLALPPGALVQSVEVIGNNPTPLSGSYSINPTPPTIPAGNLNLFSEELRRMQEQYTENKESVYSSDEAYPPTRGKLKCRGTLRKYSYASVSFYPFSYLPQSGKLLFYETANIIINYSLPSPGSEEAKYTEQMKWDTVADERASELFINFDQFKDLYQPNIPLTSDILDIHDYVIITTSDLLSAVTTSDFYFWKTSIGYNVKIVLTTDPEIAGQSGNDLAEQIRNFLRNYYGTWGIEYVLLVGDYATVPMRYCFPDPSNHSFNPYNPYNYGGEVPTDYYYADLSYFDAFSWDYD
ncbi:MAG: hypothetical protein GY855_04425, partial [candidate division Zixibacteria bacterium]|nr:hypothetical protein [candidate division Zixibacteria bacterium]